VVAVWLAQVAEHRSSSSLRLDFRFVDFEELGEAELLEVNYIALVIAIKATGEDPSIVSNFRKSGERPSTVHARVERLVHKTTAVVSLWFADHYEANDSRVASHARGVDSDLFGANRADVFLWLDVGAYKRLPPHA
jgi:hypothetical protein